MHPSRRRKKRPNYGIRTVEVLRGPNGFGFTISGQQPCILSCIVQNSPADHAGLRAGDFLISVNGISVSKITHDAVVNLIGNCVGPIRMTIAENYYSDSSEEELEVTRMVSARKPKHAHKPRPSNQRPYKPPEKDDEEIAIKAPEDGALIECKALVGYLGTIEMPKQLLPNSRLQTVCSCIRKLRQEKRSPTAVLMTIFPTCLTLKNASNHILAIYPTNRVVYIGTTADREPKYFGLVTSAVSESANPEKKVNNTDDVEISNSCHVFMVDPKITEHSVHVKKGELFKFACTSDLVTGGCLEFPSSALYIVNLVQSMYKLQGEVSEAPVLANSPQPSASSNSDSGIGFRDDCGNISDRILVVEFPANRPALPVLQTNNNRPTGIDASSAVALETLNSPLNNNGDNNYEINNTSRKNLDIKLPNNLSKSDENTFKIRQKNNLNNIRACENVNIKNVLEKTNNDVETVIGGNRLTCRAMPDRVAVKTSRGISPSSVTSSDDNVRTYRERAVDVPAAILKKSYETLSTEEPDDTLSNHSSKSDGKGRHVFKAPKFFDSRKFKKQSKIVNSCENLDRFDDLNYKLSPKVYGLSKPNHSCEELNNLDSCIDKCNYGSLQDLSSWSSRSRAMRNIAQSEPDVRMKTKSANGLCDEDNGNGKCNTAEGPAGWATSFERLLEDPLGLHTFAEFLKKEFSAENIYFWTACERFRRLMSDVERVTEAQRIYQQHLCVGAPEPVNVDAQARQCAEQTLRQANCHMFEQPQKQIFNLMKFDSYPRFLKSTLYKECLSGASDRPRQLDAGLLLQPTTPGSKLKKSLSNAEDRRRKSLLPWHRKNRSKSKDRGESEYDGAEDKRDLCDSSESVKSDVHSSKSSLTSLDLALTSSQDLGRIGSQDELNSRVALCRVILSNGSTTVVQIRESETIQQLVSRLLDKRGLVYTAFEVYTDKHQKAVGVAESSKSLAGCEVTVEQRVVFKLDLPNRKVISVKSKFSKIIADVLTPILLKYNYRLDSATVTRSDGEPVDLRATVLAIDGARLKIHYNNPPSAGSNVDPLVKVTACASATVAKANSKLDEITNQVFEGILKEKSDSVSLKSKSDNKSVKSEDWGSEHSSGIIGRFLRRDSGLHDRRKKILVKTKSEDENGDVVKKPLIAKLKTGVNKLQVSPVVSPCLESDELVEGLTRAQRSRLEDQRGTEINYELPDFLKDNSKITLKKSLETSRFHLDKSASCVKSQTNNYENRSITCKDISNNNSSFSNNNNSPGVNKVQNFRFYSPTNSPKSTETTPSKCGSLDNTVIEVDKRDSPKTVEPPPLPPKPKIVPIKPPNWGQNGFVRPPPKEVRNPGDKTLYLEQPSSSFV